MTLFVGGGVAVITGSNIFVTGGFFNFFGTSSILFVGETQNSRTLSLIFTLTLTPPLAPCLEADLALA